MTVFYRGGGVLVTDEVFAVRHPAPRSFFVRELTRVQIVETTKTKPVGDKVVRAVWIGAAAVVLGVAVTNVRVLGPSVPAVLGLVVLLLVSSVSWGNWRSPHSYQMCATYRGDTVCLFQTADQRVLGQVSRALLRAMERDLTR